MLADEINRAPAKVQSALLEVMAERQVSIGGQTRAVPAPFLVLATQNPIESEGVYTLPEAQRDRFLMQIVVRQPSLRRGDRDRPAHGRAAARGRAGAHRSSSCWRSRPRPTTCSSTTPCRTTPCASSWPPATRRVGPARPRARDRPRRQPAATLGLLAAGRALALLRGRRYLLPQDVFDVAPEVLRHRLMLSYDALAEDVTVDDLIAPAADHSPRPASPPSRTSSRDAAARRRPAPRAWWPQ